MKSKRNFVLTSTIAAIGVTALVCVFIVERMEFVRQEEKNIQYEKTHNAEKKLSEELQNITLLNSSEIDLLEGLQVKEIIGYEEMVNCANYISGYNSNAAVRFDVKDMFYPDESNFYMIAFAAYTEETAASLEVSLDGIATKYYITCQPNAFYLPIKSSNDIKIKLEGDFQNTYIGNICIVETEKLFSGRYGQYDLTDVKEMGINSGVQISDLSCRSVLTDNGYIYALVKNGLEIYKSEENDLILLKKVENLGNTVHMAFASDSVLAVTSRENDVFFIDVSEPEVADVVSVYDCLDLATGVETCKGYIFICSRYYGVEIVDISDVFNPKLCSIINTGGECIDCCINDGYLYISNWNLKMISVYDVSNPNEPQKVNQISTDGNPYGCLVRESNLIIATGHHSASNYGSKEDGGYGAGHGMEIYDVTNPLEIKWKSTVKADGRLYYRALDNWGVYANGNYVYMSSTYSGIYVYDITNVNNPKRILKIAFRVNKSDEAYNYSDSDGYVFPYDPREYLIEPISGIAFGENCIYLAGQNIGLYEIPMETENITNKETLEELAENDGHYFLDEESFSIKEIDYTIFSNGNSVNSVTNDNGYVYLASGDAGIEVLTDDGTLIGGVKTQGAAQDIVIYDEIAYVAEGNYGIEVFRIIEKDRWELLSTYRCSLLYETITQLCISADGKKLLVQDGWTRTKLLNVLDSGELEDVELINTGTMYFRNLIDFNETETFLGYTSSNEIGILEITSGGTIEENSVKNTIYEERNGMCGINDDCILAIYKNGYIVIPTAELLGNADLTKYEVHSLGENYKLRGKVSTDGTVLVVCDAYERRVTIVDISNLEIPRVIITFNTFGNPDIAEITEEKIYIPLKYQGVMIINR